jgi:hypothetical protein
MHSNTPARVDFERRVCVRPLRVASISVEQFDGSLWSRASFGVSCWFLNQLFEFVWLSASGAMPIVSNLFMKLRRLVFETVRRNSWTSPALFMHQ